MEQNFQSVTVKEEDIKEEPHDYVIGSQTEDEKPALELHCKTEPHTAEDGTSYNAELVAKTERDTETDGSSDETEITAVEIEVQLEDDEEEQDNRLDLGVPEPPHGTQQQFHGQNEELNLQPIGVLQHHSTLYKITFTDLPELGKPQQDGARNPRASEKRRYTCSECDKTFKKDFYLKWHMRAHAKPKSQRCKQCGKVLANSTVYIKHMLTHTGEMPHKCVRCGKAFWTSACLKRHMLAHCKEASQAEPV